MDKETRQEFIKQEFIAAAKTIIENERVEAVSARNISKISGYSYATLYNYFKDIDTLLTHVGVDYLEESYQFMINDLNENDNPRDRIIHCSGKYFEYMAKNPSIFKIIFINNFGEITEEVAKNLVPKVTVLLRETLNQIEPSKLKLSKETTFQLISSSLHGKLMFYIFKRGNLDYDMLLQIIKEEIRELIEV
jgi:AcrR family transcriptional regulator